MTRRYMGRTEAATCLGVSTQHLWNIRHGDPAFPQPLATLRCGPIWDADEIEDYAATRNRKPGRKKNTVKEN